MKKLITFLILIFSFTVCWGQNEPPRAAATTTENNALIDEFVKLSGFEKFFDGVCQQEITRTAIAKKWDTNKINEIKKKVKFEDFKQFTIYNAYAGLTKEELTYLVSLYKSLKLRNQESSLLTISPIIFSNISNYVYNISN